MSSSVHPADSPPCRAHAAAQRGEQRPPLPRRAHDGAHGAHARPRADSGFGGLKQKGSAAGSRQVPGGTRGPPGRRPPRASTPLHLHPPHARDHRGERDHQSRLDRPAPRFAFASFRRRKPVTSRDVKASGPGGRDPEIPRCRVASAAAGGSGAPRACSVNSALFFFRQFF